MWLKQSLDFNGNETFPAGYQLTLFVEAVHESRFDAEDIKAAKETQAALIKTTGVKPWICVMTGYLAVIERQFVTDMKPANSCQLLAVSTGRE